MMACSLQTDTCQVSEWAARLESEVTVKTQRNEEVTPSGYLEKDLSQPCRWKDPTLPSCHGYKMVPWANPKACWGVWDETGVTKPKSQPYVALPTVPGSLDASVHCFSYMELRPSERNPQARSAHSCTAGQNQSGHCSPQSHWAGQWDRLVTSELRLTRPLNCHDDAVTGVHFKPLSTRLLRILPATPGFLHTVGWGAGDTGL